MTARPGRAQVAAAVALAGFAAFYFLSALSLSQGTPARPGPGLVPLVIGSLLLLCTAGHLVATLARLRLGPGGAAAGWAGRNRRAVAGILASTVVYPLILEPLKFVVATAGVAFVMLALLSPGRLVVSLVLALGMTLAAFAVFARLLGVALPSGPLENALLQLGR